MISTDNVLILRKFFPKVLEFYEHYANSIDHESVIVYEAKNKLKTMAIRKEDKTLQLHSQYNPHDEAVRFIEGVEQVDSYKHVLFWGVGLGYHIDVFMEKYPRVNFSLFEPNSAVFYKFLEYRNLTDFSIKQLKNIYIDSRHTENYIDNLFKGLYDQVLIVVPPAYERIYKDELSLFFEVFKKYLEQSRMALHTNLGYERLWVLNSFKNFPKVLNTPSILRNKKSFFANKPVIIAAAGPSLEDEYDNLKVIKEKGLAYIVSVGSANKALLSQGIVPDMVTSYDPNPHNKDVFQEIIESGRTDIPLVFGSSVGYQTVQEYPGPLLHMVTSQDIVAQFLLEQEGLQHNGEVISDAPSIAVLTVQLMAELGANPIVLVGQNFSFKKDKYYAGGIEYQGRPTEISEQEKEGLIAVESTDGATVLTSKSHISSRLQLQGIIALYLNHTRVINTTKGGAIIDGTTFIHLEELMDSLLSEENVVDKKWHLGESETYDTEQIANRLTHFKSIQQEFVNEMDQLVKIIKKMERHHNHREHTAIEKLLPKFDKCVNKYMKKEYFDVFIRPFVRTQHEILSRASKGIQQETDMVKKARLAIDKFGPFLYECQQMHILCNLLMNELKNNISLEVHSEDESQNCLEEMGSNA